MKTVCQLNVAWDFPEVMKEDCKYYKKKLGIVVEKSIVWKALELNVAPAFILIFNPNLLHKENKYF